MKIQSKHSILKKVTILLSIIVFLIGIFITYAAYFQYWPFNANDTIESQKTKPSVSEINDTPEASVKNPESPNNANESERNKADHPKQITPGNKESVDTKPIAPNIARADKIGNTIEVVATFNTTANGHCELKLSKSGEDSIYKEARITVGPSYYVCGFTADNIFGDGWSASVTHVYKNNKSDTVSQKVR